MAQASIGALLIFYNVTVVAYSLPFVGHAIFASTDRVQSAISTLALISTGYLAKPVAQAVSGSYADRHGRKPVLVVASAVTVTTSVLLAVLPTTRQIGLAAPVLFTGIIAVQAAAAGSEWPLLAAYVAESTPPNRRGYFTAYASFNVCLGWLLAIVVPLLLHQFLTDQQYGGWGWRVGFVPAVALGILGVALRRRLPESTVFVSMKRDRALSRAPLAELFRRQGGRWALMMAQIGAVSAAFNLTVAFPVVFVALDDKFTPVEALEVGLVGLATLVAGMWAAGALADRVGARPVGVTGYVLLAVLALPAYKLMSDGQLWLAIVGVLLVGAALSLPAGVYEAWLTSAFRSRYTGAATTCNGLALALFGSPVLWLATNLVRHHGYLAPAGLLLAAAVVGAATALLLPRSIHDPLG